MNMRASRKIRPAQRLGWAIFLVGIALAWVAHVADLGAPPLYDGVVVVEPYVWLDPPLDHPAGAEGVVDTVHVGPEGSEVLTVSTPEISPQAQVFGVPGALELPNGATALTVSIEPVRPTVLPSSGYIDGNVYRVEITDQEGRQVTADPEAQVTVVLRAANSSLDDATIEQFDGVSWRPLDTENGGLDVFYAIVTDFGDFAVVAAGTSPYPTVGPSVAATSTPEAPAPSPGPTTGPAAPLGIGSIEPLVLAGLGVVALAFGLLAVFGWRRRRQPPRGWNG